MKINEIKLARLMARWQRQIGELVDRGEFGLAKYMRVNYNQLARTVGAKRIRSIYDV